MSNLDKKLDFYVKHNQNVLFTGKQGIGKSSIIIDCFERNNLNFLYFSAATMDPWVDFVGIPKERKTEDGKSFIELIRPQAIAMDTVDAIFFDEFNRAPKKVRNGTMELLQFKSINGLKLNNLKMIWAAINPDEVEDEAFAFDVERLDPAQKDRFQIYIDLPYKIDKPYFSKKYSPAIADISTEWWDKLEPKVKNQVSPRRVDYALDLFQKGGDMRDVLPNGSNVGKLVTALKVAPYLQQLNDIYAEKNLDAAKEFLNNDNNFFSCSDLIKGNKKYMDFYVPLFSQERVAQCLASDKVFKDYILANSKLFKSILEDITKANVNKDLSKEVAAVVGGGAVFKSAVAKFKIDGPDVIDKELLFLGIISSSEGLVRDLAPWQRRNFLDQIYDQFPAKASPGLSRRLMTELFAVLGKSNRGTLDATKVMKTLNTLVVMSGVDWKEYFNALNGVAKSGAEKIINNAGLSSAFIVS